ncbi:hypothetical protein BCR41DRAFT_350406 [Lobosporangium transversale]|uniref:DUF202 domain-containing protein n=1 Tax=Lobosporangium transversale TaxID=64571 RepID=A0A1Y2GRV9_9FUNG|nr:hypothetical protein BCR41DRAFT_350406 [Lobosporangium transversale]ORZ20861.1 hypothetical protein BCR41DRAFT_350406 [Lobosporangium transversale]|eukprot:XP_021882770.1 hypothetical protein BCR41DRAFT_350406 [Lobosporangium transversale]
MKRMGRLAQFNNERLYLHWIRLGVLQGGIAVTLLSFGLGVTSYVGVGALILALLTLIYATTLYHKRHLHLVHKRSDVKYFARTIPTFLTVGLILLYASNFACKSSLSLSLSFIILIRSKRGRMVKKFLFNISFFPISFSFIN